MNDAASLQLSPRQRRRLLIIYGVWALLLLTLGTLWLGRVSGQIGLTFGGFVWTHDPTLPHAFWVAPELWRTSGSSELHLRVKDQIDTIAGMTPWEFERVYSTTPVGAMVTYVVERGGRQFQIKEPVRLFTWEDFVLSHGLLYAAGLASILSGYVLLRRTRRLDFAVFAFSLLAAAGAWLSHSEVAGIHRPYTGHGLFEFLTYTPSLPLTGAFLLHFSLLFPAPSRTLTRFPYLPHVGYALAASLIIAYTITLKLRLAPIHNIVNLCMYVFAACSILLVMTRSILAYVDSVRTRNRDQQQLVAVLAGVWAVAIATFLGLGVFPLFLVGRALLPFEIIITLVALYPIVLVYALGNAETIDRLQREMTLKQQYASTVQELQNVREHTLHEIADNLHDQVIPDLRGLHYAAVALSSRLQGLELHALSQQAGFVAQGLDQVSEQARTIMAGVKPVDWSETDLSQSLTWLALSMKQSDASREVVLDIQSYDQPDPPAVQEALYWIARSALSNVQEHARANLLVVRLQSIVDGTSLEIIDNGVGVDWEHLDRKGARARRGLGFTNMRLRAMEIGAEFSVESKPGQGTRVSVLAPRPAIPAITATRATHKQA